MAVKILLTDDHRILRQGLRSILEKQDGFEVVGEAGDGRSAVKLARKLRPDVVVMDVAMPDLNGVEAARLILADLPETRILALSMHADARFIARMLQAGAVGYLLKECALEELITAIQDVLAGRTYLGPAVVGPMVKDYLGRFPAEEPTGVSVLTPREREVLQLIAEGKSTKEAAAMLHVSVKTVESHRKQIMDKLDVRSVAGLTKFAVRHGLTEL